MTPEKPRRRTSKALLIINSALAWLLAFYSVYAGQGGAVAGACVAFVAALYGIYTGIGHMDLRTMLTALASNIGSSYGSTYFPPVPSPELEGDDGGYPDPATDWRGN